MSLIRSVEPLIPGALGGLCAGTLDDAKAAIGAALGTSTESDRAKGQILDFINLHPDALHRTCLEGHLTGSALVVDAERQHLLLMLHSKLEMWLQPGGHADGNGNLSAVALREAKEETGILELQIFNPAVDCDVHEIPAFAGEPKHLHLDVRYLALAPEDASFVGNHESQGLRWFSPGELKAVSADESLMRLAAVGLEIAQTL